MAWVWGIRRRIRASGGRALANAGANGQPHTGFHADLARPKRNGRKPWTHEDAQDKAHALLRRKSLGRLTGARGRPKITPADRAPWTVEQITAFKQAGERLVLDRKLSPSFLKVHFAKADLLADRGQCWASAETLSKLAGVSVAVVKKARQALVRSLWRAPPKVGRKAVYFPAFKPGQPFDNASEKPSVVPFGYHYSTSKSGLSPASQRGKQAWAPSNDNSSHIKAPAPRPVQHDLFRGQSMADPVLFGRQLRDERLRLGLSQGALGERIGCKQPHLANVERGHDQLGEWSRQRLREVGVRL